MFSKIFRPTALRRAFSTVPKRVSLFSQASLVGAASVPLLRAGAFATIAAATLCLTQQEQVSCHHQGETPYTGVPGTEHERTFIAIKPDGVQRQIVGEIISRFEKKGYKLVAMKMIWASKEKAAGHYADLAGKPFFNGLVDYFSSGPIIAMVWEGPDAILTGRKLLGATNPLASAPGTIRGDYCVRVGRNIIHGSDGPDSATHEIGFWFTEQEVSNWNRTLDSWITDDN